MGAFFFLVMGIWALVSAIEYDWFTRADAASWYSWPAMAVPESLQEAGAALTCSISLGGVCAPVAAPAQHAGLTCWAANGATWCADPAFATATAIWSVVSLACFILSRLLWPTLGALPPEAGPRARRNHAWFQIGLEAVMIVWMGWTVYDIVHDPGGTDAAGCTGSGTACVYDVADRLPEAAFYVVMVLVGVVGMLDTSMRHRREIFCRAEPVSQSVQ
ncbi:MAG: hypothetical protein ABUL54_11830 [Dongia sp.]